MEHDDPADFVLPIVDEHIELTDVDTRMGSLHCRNL